MDWMALPFRQAAGRKNCCRCKDSLATLNLPHFPIFITESTKLYGIRRVRYPIWPIPLAPIPACPQSLLRLANSAFYGLPSKTDSITRAVTLIGTKEISTLAMGVLAIRFFKDIPQQLINMKTFWTHSVACGIIAGILAQHKIGFTEEKFFIAGLLHDIGRLIMSMGLPRNMTYAVSQSRRGSTPLYEIEDEIFGFNHTKAAALLMQKWEFPIALKNMVRHHHDPIGFPRSSGIINNSHGGHHGNRISVRP